MRKSDLSALLPLSGTVFYILLSLADGETHGYAVIKEVDRLTGGSIRLSPATLYRVIRQLCRDGWIDEAPSGRDDDPRRRYYRLTARGREVARLEAARLAVVVRVARERRLLPATVP